MDWNCGSYQYSGHRGSDYGVGGFDGMDAGRDLVAAAAGTVVYTNDGEYDRCDTGDCDGGGGYGNYVKIQHDDGRYTYYAHMSQWSVAVSKGDRVECGTYLGLVGSSGYSTGPHIHFEVRESSGSQSDPFDGNCSHPPSYWVSQGHYMGVPAMICEDLEPCDVAGSLSCGDAIDGSNDQSGSTNSHSYYGCSEWSYTGSEYAWSFSTNLDETVDLSLTGISDDLDLYVLASDACDGSDCLAYSDNSNDSDESISFTALAGTEYVVLLDGWESATSNFHLEVDCEGDSPDPQDSDPPQTGDSTPDEGDSGEDSGEGVGPTGDTNRPADQPPWERSRWQLEEGCGCASSVPLGAAPLLVLLLGLGRRRRLR